VAYLALTRGDVQPAERADLRVGAREGAAATAPVDLDI
jgi:hypothetical protein